MVQQESRLQLVLATELGNVKVPEVVLLLKA